MQGQESSFAHNADSFFYVLAGFDLIDHGNRIIGIGNHAFALAVENQFLAAQNVLSGSFAISLKISGRADISPVHIVELTEFLERLSMTIYNGHSRFGEWCHINNRLGMLRINIKASRPTYDQQACSLPESTLAI